jgi:polyhydroxybutyrate depolymerase
MEGFNTIYLILVVCCAIPAGCNTTNVMASDAKQEQYTLIHDGITRTYSVYAPKGIHGYHDIPLMIALHGGQGSAEKWPEYTDKGFERLADREHFILVYPNGLDGQWNDGRGVEHFYSQREGIDDVGFLVGIIEELSDSYPVDPDRVYIIGVSNGGMMAHRLAAEHSDKVAAFASVIASIPANLEGKLKPKQPVSVLMINGTKDPLVRWQGGPVKFGRKVNGDVMSVDRTVSFWTAHDKCDSNPQTINLPDRAPDDGTRVERVRYSDCRSATEVVMYRIIGGGHTWPMYQETRGKIATKLLDKLVGKRSRDIDACEVIWEFFKEHPRKPPGDRKVITSKTM